MSAPQCAPGLPADPRGAPPADLRHTAGKFYSTTRHQAIEPKRDRDLRNAAGHRATHSSADQQVHQIFPVHMRKCHTQTLSGACPCLQYIEVSEKRPAGMESRPPGAGYISTAWDGEQITESDAEGSASIAVRQRPHASAEEQLNAVLGDGSAEAEAPLDVYGEVRGGHGLLGHLR